MHTDNRQADASLTAFTTDQRREAMARFAVLRSHLDNDMPLSQAADEAGIAVRTAQRWLARYRANGLAGLTRSIRSDAGHRKLASPVAELIEGMALRKPQLSVATIHRRVLVIAEERKWSAPSYGSVYRIVSSMDPAMVTLAQEGPSAFRDRFELLYRHRADRPNAIWQADHTELDILILDANGEIVRPWLTTVIDDHSRAVTGYMVFLGAPSALQTSLALRQAIWRKQDPAWPVCGIPDVLYVDHGCDFTSTHLEQVAADLHIQLIYSATGRPQGRGKIERLFGTLNTELLPELPGHLKGSKPATPARLSIPELDAAIGAYIIGTYNIRVHRETGASPHSVWIGDGWLPRMPESLEALDLLLIMVAKSRLIHRDGIHFQGLRYLDPTLAAYVGESVTIRYDPRDLAEIRIFHRNRFLCRAVSPEHAGQTVTLKDIQSARSQHRLSLRNQINERITRVVDFLPQPEKYTPTNLNPAEQECRPPKKLRTYREDS